MSTTVFLNGAFYGPEGSAPLAQARVSAFDAGFQHSVGLFETLQGGRQGGGSRLTKTGQQVLALYGAIYAQSLAASAKELRRLHGLLK